MARGPGTVPSFSWRSGSVQGDPVGSSAIKALVPKQPRRAASLCRSRGTPLAGPGPLAGLRLEAGDHTLEVAGQRLQVDGKAYPEPPTHPEPSQPVGPLQLRVGALDPGPYGVTLPPCLRGLGPPAPFDVYLHQVQTSGRRGSSDGLGMVHRDLEGGEPIAALPASDGHSEGGSAGVDVKHVEGGAPANGIAVSDPDAPGCRTLTPGTWAGIPPPRR
jgi:hypothetical protein